jgi:flagellar protein FliS
MSFAIQAYQAARVETGSPLQLVIQLYDGAIRFMRRACLAMNAKEYALKGQNLNKAHAIITELNATLEHDHAPDLAVQLEQLYGFVLDRIIEANLKNDPESLQPAIRVLEQLRSGWSELLKQQNGGR